MADYCDASCYEPGGHHYNPNRQKVEYDLFKLENELKRAKREKKEKKVQW